MHRRLKNLTAMIGSKQNRAYTLEDLCWAYWRVNQRRFIALANGDCPYLRVFVDLFQRKETFIWIGGSKVVYHYLC
jgi:hypothetical protein